MQSNTFIRISSKYFCLLNILNYFSLLLNVNHCNSVKASSGDDSHLVTKLCLEHVSTKCHSPLSGRNG